MLVDVSDPKVWIETLSCDKRERKKKVEQLLTMLSHQLDVKNPSRAFTEARELLRKGQVCHALVYRFLGHVLGSRDEPDWGVTKLIVSMSSVMSLALVSVAIDENWARSTLDSL